ncbi:MAG TPA: M1 family metallopeptidase [Thermoanaerobaculaceae bacterium]|nr:M1 family metallopeptidase [Thermoanaerobaculaceae bacterium]HPS77540.1 M1 family metallopeptidase [Thermoanaerobaculaceae bacterium]
MSFRVKRQGRSGSTPLLCLAAFALLLTNGRPTRAQEGKAAASGPQAGALATAPRPVGVATPPAPVYSIAMEVTYDPATRSLEGHQHLRWRNTARVPVPDLELHLYLNAFANTDSTFFRESRGQLRGFESPAGKWGWTEITGIRTAAGANLKAAGEFIRPDDDNPEDRTVVRYPLPAPLPPGQSIDVEIAFEGQLPGVFARNGARGDFVLGGQWFPKIGVFEDAGVRERTAAGWNCHQYHANSEFYADFGDYDVSVTLPIRYRGHVGGTGLLVSETATADQVTARFVARNVNDFAWTGDPAFEVVRDRFDPATDVPPAAQARIAGLLGLQPAEIALSPVDITLFVRPEHRGQARRYLSSMRVALGGYGLRLGAFPYSHITMVDPPRGALGSGGMEYLTFITLGTHALLAIPPFDRILLPEMVTIHELGHNYWMGLIASNEFEESWIDEGINSYYEMVMTDETYPSQVALLGFATTAFESNHASQGGGHFMDPIARESWRFRSGGSYGLNSYQRPAIALRHLEGLVGTTTFHRAMRHFFQEWQFRHPSTTDFEQSFQASAGRDLGWFFEQAFHSTRTLDYAVTSISSRQTVERSGYYWRKGVRTLEGEDEAKEQKKDIGTSATTLQYRNVVVVERLGEFVHPVTVQLVFADGQVERHEWDGRERWQRFESLQKVKLVSAQVDPDDVMALDVNRLNNSRLLKPRRAPASKLLVHLLFWLQNLLAATALLG